MKSGKVQNLRFMMDRGCPYHDNLLYVAAGIGVSSLYILKYLIETQGLYMDTDGSLFDCALKPVSVRILYERELFLRRGYGYFEPDREMQCVQYLLDVGCPYTAESYDKYLALLEN